MEKRSLDLFKIKFTGLKLGLHEFDFELGDTFFRKFDYSDIYNTQFTVLLDLDKRESMMVLEYNISGKATYPCDRCGDDYTFEIEADDQLIVKLSGDDADDVGVITLGQEEFVLDVSQAFYETIVVNLPLRRVHDRKDCNQEVLKKLEELERESDENNDNIDPRWSQLNNLK